MTKYLDPSTQKRENREWQELMGRGAREWSSNMAAINTYHHQY